MEEILNNIDLHEPLAGSSYGIMAALLVALAAGVALSIFCKVYYRGFALWGFLVDSLGLLFFWLILTVLALKWALVVAAGIALPIWILFYIDEQSVVTAVELEQAAIQRESWLQLLFESDPDAARSMAETLSLGNDDATGDWPEGSVFQGIPRRIVRNGILMLIGGYAALIFVAVNLI